MNASSTRHETPLDYGVCWVHTEPMTTEPYAYEEDDNWEYDRETRRAVRPSTPRPLPGLAKRLLNKRPTGARPEDGSPS